MSLDVLFPFHRVDSFLIDAVSSLALAKGPSFRVILIDDRPIKTGEIRDLFLPLKKSVIVETSGGVGYGQALELGSKLIEAENVALFNSDDLMSEERFIKQVQSLRHAEVCITRMWKKDRFANELRSLAGQIRSTVYHPSYLLFGAYGANATWCMKSEWWLRNAFFDSSLWLDWRIAMRSFLNSKVVYLNEPLYTYRQHGNQITNHKSFKEDDLKFVHQEWVNFNSKIGIANSNRQAFDVFATPWVRNHRDVSSIAVNAWLRSYREYSKILPREILITSEELIARRVIIASVKSRNFIPFIFKPEVKVIRFSLRILTDYFLNKSKSMNAFVQKLIERWR
jgi:hypothetical protein